MSDDSAPKSGDLSVQMTIGWIRLLGVYHVLIAVLLFYLLFMFWPTGSGGPAGDVRIFGRFTVPLNSERQILILVMLAGALGSYVHAATSFVNFTGTRSIVASWRWWYGLRPFIGMALALGFYFGVRASFFSVSADSAKDLNVIGFTATGFMVGMFTKQATHKLGELFDVLFRVPPSEEPQKDQLGENPPAPSKPNGGHA